MWHVNINVYRRANDSVEFTVAAPMVRFRADRARGTERLPREGNIAAGRPTADRG